ncbi:MAG: polyisoprenoid-binding protein [Betaproteobacteria bacterium]|nr:MAG: polyisoprenoid-binding protein [Betaproteobacteria bacterium]
MRKAFLGALVAVMPLAAAAQVESYTIDPIHSFVNFTIDHLGFTTLHGRFDKSTGKATVDRAGRKGTVDLVIEAASISTGDNDKGSRPRSRDEHLRSADFFNVAEFPRISFKGNVKFSGDGANEVEGQVTLLGVTKPVVFKMDRWKCGVHPFSKKEMCGGYASGKIKRTDFGMKYGVPAIGDEISLMVGFEAYKD